jgi:glycosyltransferase involved in cell wall biosynthesis
MKNHNPLVSVIVPAYNAAPYIRKSLDSIRLQTYRNLEIIVINDGSTDGTGNIIKQMAQNDDRIRYRAQENHGVSYTRNQGLAESRGKYIIWVDADDFIAPDLVESVVHQFEQTEADIVVFGYECFSGKQKVGETVIPPMITDAGQWFKRAAVDFISMLMTYSARADLWKGISFLSERTHMGEDGAATIEIFGKAKKVAVIPECLYYYNKGNSNSLTKQVSADIFYEQMEGWLERAKICEEYFPDFSEYCMQRVLSHAVKTQCFLLAGMGISDGRKDRAKEVLAETDFSMVHGRFRDKILRLACIHNMDWICRWYGRRKYRKMLIKNNQQKI